MTDRLHGCESGVAEADCAIAEEASTQRWSVFQDINADRRAIRDFDGEPIPDEEIRAVLSEALLAPSSANLQPYVIHWFRGAAIKHEVAVACQNQRAALSASTLLVFVASSRIALETASMLRAHVEATPTLGEKARAYHLRQLKKFERFLRIAPLIVWSPLHSLLSTIFPSLSLLPIGPQGVRNSVARSALFAAQTVLLAASARGLDTCPMEGFNARKLSLLLGLKRGDVIPIVVAIGRRRKDAVVEPRWRRPFEAAVRLH